MADDDGGPGGPGGPGGYSFRAEPRAVAARKKFRPQKGGQSPGGMMLDRRVTRGGGGSRNQEEDVEPARKKDIYDIRIPEKGFVPVDLTAFLEEQTPAVVTVTVDTQTDEFEPMPQEAPFMPRKTGIDAATQIEEADGLFNFDMEVEPILQVLLSKTMEQAKMEVEEEEEIYSIRQRRSELDEANAAERRRVQAMEAAELARWQDKERLIQKERARVRREVVVREKVASVKFTQAMLSTAQDAVFQVLQDEGYFKDYDREMVEHEFLPWIYQNVQKKLSAEKQARDLADDLVQAGLGKGYTKQADRKCWIRVIIKATGLPDEPVGPVPVYPADSVWKVIKNIQKWMRKHLLVKKVDLRKGSEKRPDKKSLLQGFDNDKKEKADPWVEMIEDIHLYYAGKELAEWTVLLNVVKDLNKLEVRCGVEEEEKGKDDEDSSDYDSDDSDSDAD